MWFKGDVVGDAKNSKKKTFFQENEVKDRSVLLSTFAKCFVQIFSAQWREDMLKTTNIILGCFRGLGNK